MNPIQIVLSLPTAHPWLPPLLTTPTPLATLPSPMQRAHAALVTVWTAETRVCSALIPAFNRGGVTCGLAVIPGHVFRFALHDQSLELLLILPSMIIRIHPRGLEIVRHSAIGLPREEDITGFETHAGHKPGVGRLPQHPLDYSAFAANVALLSGLFGSATVDVRVDDAVVAMMCEGAAEREGPVFVNDTDFRSRDAKVDVDVDDVSLRKLRNRESAQRSHFRKRLEVERLSREVKKGWDKVTDIVEREKGLRGETDWLKKIVGW